MAYLLNILKSSGMLKTNLMFVTKLMRLRKVTKTEISHGNREPFEHLDLVMI